MTTSGVPLADRLRRIASARSGRPLPEPPDPSRVAAVLGAAADPPITDAVTADVLARAVSGVVGSLPGPVADRLTSGLGLPGGALDPATDFAPVEERLVQEFLDDRGVLDVRSCRGGHGRSALLTLVGLVDRCAGPAGAAAGT